MNQKLEDLPSRIMAHTLGATLVALCIIFANNCYFRPFFTLFLSIIAIASLMEFYGLLRKKGLKPANFVGNLFCFLYIFAVFLSPYVKLFPLPQIILGLAFFIFFLSFATPSKEPLLNISTSFFGLIYIAIPFSLIVKITYHFPDLEGSFWLAFLILVTKSADMGGYFLGRFFGRRKLSPKISPKKTVEGAVGGVISSIIVALLLCLYRDYFLNGDGNYLMFGILGLSLGIVGQFGDLAESLFKRDADVKDSSKIPGIGGILDVVDSLLFTAPFLFIFLKLYYNN